MLVHDNLIKKIPQTVKPVVMQTTELWGTWPSNWLLKTHLSIPNTAFSNFLEDPEWTLPTSELIREISMDSLGIRGVVDGEGLETSRDQLTSTTVCPLWMRSFRLRSRQTPIMILLKTKLNSVTIVWGGTSAASTQYLPNYMRGWGKHVEFEGNYISFDIQYCAKVDSPWS